MRVHHQIAGPGEDFDGGLCENAGEPSRVAIEVVRQAAHGLHVPSACDQGRFLFDCQVKEIGHGHCSPGGHLQHAATMVNGGRIPGTIAWRGIPCPPWLGKNRRRG
jgi:hypothetical protein